MNKRTSDIYITKDNKTLTEKVHLRKLLIQRFGASAVLETHGGNGGIFLRCYRNIPRGVVFETDSKKAEALLRQRTHWQIVQHDCVEALCFGIGSHLTIDFLDADPYGAAWSTLSAFFASKRPFAEEMTLVAHDGNTRILRWKGLKKNRRDAELFSEFVETYGETQLWKHYTDILPKLIEKVIAPAGYDINDFGAFASKNDKYQLHFWARLQK